MAVAHSSESTRHTKRKAVDARAATALEQIPNVGSSIADDLRSIGIERPAQLIGRDPLALYQALCDRTALRQDPCVLDTFISAVSFMEGAPARPWFYYTAERKRTYASNLLGPSLASSLSERRQ